MGRHQHRGQSRAEDLLGQLKIERSFRDPESPLHVDEVPSKTGENVQKLILMMLIVYTIAVPAGEKVRDRQFSGEKKWSRYSGLFIPLQPGVALDYREFRRLKATSFLLFQTMLRSARDVAARVGRSLEQELEL